MIRQSKQFGMVTTEIIRDPTLSVTAKTVYALLSTYANKKSQCYPTIKTLSERLNVHRKTVERAINEFMALNNLSLKEVRYKLMSKGIPNDLIEDYINSHDEEMENYETKSAKTIIMKKQNQMDEEAIIQYLLKKGYKTSNIRQAIELLDD